jgi:hypothetical protein
MSRNRPAESISPVNLSNIITLESGTYHYGLFRSTKNLMAEVVKEANLEYEAELKRNPNSVRTWLNYIAESKACSNQV